jgi:hypothetical protein
MSWFTNLFAGSAGSLVEKVGNVVDEFNLSDEEKQQFKLEMEALMQKRDSEVEQTLRTELQTRERILVAELQQGDSYTKRARPTVVYAGLGFIFFNYVLVPSIAALLASTIEPFKLPTEFWLGWSGIVATWSVGRTFEKRGAQGSLTRAITGSTQRSSLLDDEKVG